MTAAPGEVTWHCPYCDETADTLLDIQQHITNSSDGEHAGVSGKSPDEDIVATDEDGSEIDVYERSDVVRPQHAPLQDVSKRKQIVYVWLANDREEDSDAFAAVTEADHSYVGQILGQIRRGEITRDYWADSLDRELLEALRSRLEAYREEQSTTENEESETMSSSQQSVDEEEQPDVSAKTIVLNTFDLAGEGINRKQAWEALSEAGVLDVGYEYFRRVYKEAADGEHDVDEAVDDQVQSVIEPVLFQAGVVEGEDASGAEEQEEEVSTSAEQPASSSTSRPVSGGIDVEGLQALRDRIELLRRQVEYEAEGEDGPEFRKARFIADEAISGLDELIDG